MAASDKNEKDFLDSLIGHGPGEFRRSLPLLIQRIRSQRSADPAGGSSLWDPTAGTRNEPLRRLLKALAALSDAELLALWRHVEGLPDDEIAKHWEAQRVGPEIPSPSAVADARESAIARLRLQPDLSHIGVYYQPLNPEQSAIAEETAESRSQADAEAVQRGIAAVRDVVAGSFADLPRALVERVRRLTAGYDELDRLERSNAEEILSSTRRKPGSRRWQHLLQRRRMSLETQLFTVLYPNARNRVVARNLLLRDLNALFAKIAEVAEFKAGTAENDMRCYFEHIALQAARCLPGGSVTQYRERVRWLRAVVWASGDAV